MEESQKRNNSKSFLIWLIKFALFAGLILIVVSMLSKEGSSPTNRIINTVLSVNPKIVKYYADTEDAKLFDFKVTVYAVVENRGGAGWVNVRFRLFEDKDKEYIKTERIYMKKDDRMSLKKIFPEAKLSKHDTYEYSVTAFPD